ncbi:hypothetical protein [Sorangium sp. So ce388]|uniref:hypothetical protein n=1 Tax=Sorangium sp. So ce388 TaxID=3133309 RepID=UPI003F5C83F4
MPAAPVGDLGCRTAFLRASSASSISVVSLIGRQGQQRRCQRASTRLTAAQATVAPG